MNTQHENNDEPSDGLEEDESIGTSESPSVLRSPNVAKGASALVLAMRPEFAEAILSGLKTAELRRCAPVRLSRGMRLFIWVSGALVGEVRLEGWDLDRSADDPAARYWNKSGLCFDDAQAYLEDARRPGVLLVGHPICYAAPRPWHGHTIQNFTYVDEL